MSKMTNRSLVSFTYDPIRAIAGSRSFLREPISSS